MSISEVPSDSISCPIPDSSQGKIFLLQFMNNKIYCKEIDPVSSSGRSVAAAQGGGWQCSLCLGKEEDGGPPLSLELGKGAPSSASVVLLGCVSLLPVQGYTLGACPTMLWETATSLQDLTEAFHY